MPSRTILAENHLSIAKFNRKVQGVPQSQTTATSRHQEDENRTDNRHGRMQDKQTNARGLSLPKAR